VVITAIFYSTVKIAGKKVFGQQLDKNGGTKLQKLMFGRQQLDAILVGVKSVKEKRKLAKLTWREY
jgi:hypothetical protein